MKTSDAEQEMKWWQNVWDFIKCIPYFIVANLVAYYEGWQYQRNMRRLTPIMGPPGPMGIRGERGERGEPCRSGSDICCPHCKVWYTDMRNHAGSKIPFFSSPSKLECYKDGPFITYTCGNCGNDSEWFTGAPVLILAEDVITSSNNNKL